MIQLDRRRKLISSKIEEPRSIYVGFVSLAIGIWFVGPSRIAFGNSRWLRPSPGRLDHAVAQLNWEFLRWSKIGQWPPFGLPNLGTGWHTVYVPFSSGSLLGIALRYLSWILPSDFQFLGLWLVISFFLMGFFAFKLAVHLTSDHALQLVGGMLLVASPLFFYRVGVLGHFELSCHWLLFAAFGQVLTSDLSFRRWSLLLVIGVIVNVYLFVMVGCLFLGHVIQASRSAENWLRFARRFLGVALTCLVALWVFGFFVYRSNAQGLGFFRLNSLAFFYPRFALGSNYAGSFSKFFDVLALYSTRDFIAFEREGFAYLGFGVIVGIVFVAGLAVRWYWRIPTNLRMPLFVSGTVSLLLFFNSLSNRIAFGRRELLQLPIPDQAMRFRQVFRTAERFSWPLYYFVVLVVILIISNCALKKLSRVMLLTMILLIQVWDISAGVVESRRILHSESTVVELVGSGWDTYLAGKRSITMFPVFDFIDDEQSVDIEDWRRNDRYFSVLELAARKKMRTNFSVTGRPVTEIVAIENERIANSFAEGQLDPLTVYIFPNDTQWRDMIKKYSDIADFAILDGFYLLVPEP